MEVILHQHALRDLKEWARENPRVLKRIFELIEDIQRQPFSGLGKPEPLKHELAGYWSRRITDSDRIVYKVQDASVFIASCKGHYTH
jgi:toxin YoeB